MFWLLILWIPSLALAFTGGCYVMRHRAELYKRRARELLGTLERVTELDGSVKPDVQKLLSSPKQEDTETKKKDEPDYHALRDVERWEIARLQSKENKWIKDDCLGFEYDDGIYARKTIRAKVEQKR